MKLSCGLLMYVRGDGGFRVLLVHPGGPYWRNKNAGAWSIPKGLPEEGEDLLAAALREFREETNLQAATPFLALTPVKQKSGKLVHCWAFEGKDDLSAFRSAPFALEWPPKSGRMAEFPEADRAALFTPAEAAAHIVPGQRPLIEQLQRLLENG